ncbi:MAG: transcriptional regulator NrdR [Candidatus Moranbacteria bacterium GW2011_GWF2_34_56]|nr:MAG: transcriptional regulator NrdR [Candidatus Moranbacteria bacterium GW2011_GWF1_34_10]KKP63785.1 MAG: transcriptional regulator NrdR [Candidatus Moranbacteria bacterium GW2011_GWF2_34_56]HBI17640.1 transcriptional regulator NrdR [Candidatus Moranbacteria bacterium]
MICPACNHSETRVVDSRDTNDGRAIRRRRECEKCKERFSTYEEVEITRLLVIKRNGEKEDYNQEKIRKGIDKSLEKRPITDDRKEKLINEIEHQIYSKGKQGEIGSKEVGKIILEKLKEVDDVAYLRFVSVYKSFGSLNSFEKELEKLKDK